MLEPVATGYRGKQLWRFFLGDAAVALLGIYEFLEAKSFGYAIRLLANTILQGNITVAYRLKLLVGSSPKKVRRYSANFCHWAGPPVGLRRAGSSPRLSGIWVNFIQVSPSL